MADEEPTYYTVGEIKGGGMSQGDIHKAIFNLERAVHALCSNLDTDAATLGTDYLAKIGTDLRTAMAKLRTPSAEHGTV